jgi:hypothetical protein
VHDEKTCKMDYACDGQSSNAAIFDKIGLQLVDVSKLDRIIEIHK